MDKKDKVSRLAKYAYTMVPFYVKKLDDNEILARKINSCNEITIENFPVITKNEIMKENSLLSAEYAFRRNDEMVKFRTSGSTGKCLEILWDKKDEKRSMLPLWMARFRYYGIKMSDKFCYFYTMGNTEDAKNSINFFEEGRTSIGFSKNNMTDKRMKMIYDKMVEFQPIWIVTQPSVAALFVRYVKVNKLGPIKSLRYMELTGELLDDTIRHEIKEVLDCIVANQYGCYEANSIAYECPAGHLHCLENTFTEITDDNGRNVGYGVDGNITITTLENHAMPFIRYELGDRGILVESDKCVCGNKNPIIEVMSGRICDYILLKNGTKINSYVFVKAIELVNREFFMAIQQYQIIQKNFEKFEVFFVLNKDIVENRINYKMIEEAFVNSIEEMEIMSSEYLFEYSEELLPDKNNGKLRYFKREFT